MFLSHKIELRPTPMQETFLLRSVGVRRFTYNQLLAHFSKEGVKYSKAAAYSKLKELKTEFPWMSEVSARTSRNVLEDIERAFAKFFRNVRSGRKPGFPKFKKKGVRDSFSIREVQKFYVNGTTLRIEKLRTKIQLRQPLRLVGTPKQCAISYKAGKWFASILIDCTEVPWKPIDVSTRKPSVGVDLGVKSLAVLSDGSVFGASQQLKKQLVKLAKLQKKYARQQKGSNRREVTKLRIQKLHFYVAEKRKAVLHELTNFLTRSYSRIVIEDLNVAGMVKNRRLARTISDCGFGEFRRQLEYKSALRDNELVVVDRWFPSTKLCSSCGQLHAMKLSDRVMNCDCGLSLDRDLNAAINLNRYIPTGLSGIKCTEELAANKRANVDSVNNVSNN